MRVAHIYKRKNAKNIFMLIFMWHCYENINFVESFSMNIDKGSQVSQLKNE